MQWSPFAARDFWVVSTSNQKALVWNLGMSPRQDPIEHILHGHTRAITDINFSAHHPDVIATCAVDSFVHCWDLRVPARPAVSFSDWFAGATQVKWSRQDSHVVASSHDKYLRIWDDRMGAYPIRSIEAHTTKIYGVDWNRFHPNKIVTCSLDRTIKFWDCGKMDDGPERVIGTPFPVRRARHTPFGYGLLAMPQRGNKKLHLYDRRTESDQSINGTVASVADFPGHKGQVKEFLWRARGTIVDGVDHRDFQLVSWDTDRELRLHRIVPETLQAVGYMKGLSQTQKYNFTRKGATYKTFRDEPDNWEFNDIFHSQPGFSLSHGRPNEIRPRGSTSVGMRKVAIPHSRGWVQGGGGLEPRIGMHGRTNLRQDMNPIAWMKNVKAASWEDALAEEMTQVGEKFANVRFEVADVQQRKATISLHGPWGLESVSMFLKIDIRFPRSYPREASALFSVQRTASMTDDLSQILSTELRTIAETHVSKKRGCLEAALRYLLREQNVEQIVMWVLDESLDDSKFLDVSVLAGDISSDEEDDDRAGAFQPPAGLLNSSDMLNTNVMVPVAKVCGALWSDSGKLVCFFPPKVKESALVFDQISGKSTERGEKLFKGFGHLWTSSPGPRNAIGNIDRGDDATSESSEEYLTSSSSSSASSHLVPSLSRGYLPPRAWRGGVMAQHRSRSADRSNLSTIGLGTVKSTTAAPYSALVIHSYEGLLPSRLELALEYEVFGNGPNVCSHNAQVAMKYGDEVLGQVWNLARLLLRNDLPLQYTSGPINGYELVTIAHSLSSSLKRNDSGVDLSNDANFEAKKIDTKGRVRWGDSSFGQRYLVSAFFDYFDRLGDLQMLAMLSCILAEPRASQPELAVSRQRSHHLPMPLRSPAFSVDYHPSLEVGQSLVSQAATSAFAFMAAEGTTGSTLLRTQDSLHSSSPRVNTNNDPTTPFTTTVIPPSQPLHKQLDHRPITRMTGGGVCDFVDHDPSDARLADVPISVSPRERRMRRRSNSNLTFTFSRAGLTALAQSYSNSPPTNSAILGITTTDKKPGPSGSIGASGWSTSNMFGGSWVGRGDQYSGPERPIKLTSHENRSNYLLPSSTFVRAHSLSSDGAETLENSRGNVRSAAKRSSLKQSLHKAKGSSGKQQVKFKISLHNQNKFDNDGYAPVPLLDPDLEWRSKAYRASYAHLLDVWKLHVQMAEILKFDGLMSYSTTDQNVANAKAAPLKDFNLDNLRWRKTNTACSKAELVLKRGVEVRRRCVRCGEVLAAVEKNGIPIGWHCVSTGCAISSDKTSTRTLCVTCDKPVGGLILPCLACGHVTCFTCAEGWYGQTKSLTPVDGDENEVIENTSCPSGCGCYCIERQQLSLPWPSGAEFELENESEAGAHQLLPNLNTDKGALVEQPLSEYEADTAIQAHLSLKHTRSVSGTDRNERHDPP